MMGSFLNNCVGDVSNPSRDIQNLVNGTGSRGQLVNMGHTTQKLAFGRRGVMPECWLCLSAVRGFFFPRG
jgi:hypothetical protein